MVSIPQEVRSFLIWHYLGVGIRIFVVNMKQIMGLIIEKQNKKEKE